MSLPGKRVPVVHGGLLPSSPAGPLRTDRTELHHRAQRHHRRRRGGGGRREDKALHGAEGIQSSIALLVGELHCGMELLRGSVGEYRVGAVEPEAELQSHGGGVCVLRCAWRT